MMEVRIKKDVWIIGTGAMALAYAKVLSALNVNYIAIGRGKENCDKFIKATGVQAFSGGLNNFLKSHTSRPKAVIVTVGIEVLKESTIALLDHGINYILLEKPGIAYANEINELEGKVQLAKATVLLAYNRRFYTSVATTKKMIEEDGGIESFNFEFTEWSHSIRELNQHKAVHNNWFLGNSTHVIDTAFYLGGRPKELCAFYKGGIDWHPASSVFAGAGISEKGALFSYSANWEAPGRWAMEFLTKKRRFILKPIEKLSIQLLGSINIEPNNLHDDIDIKFKPGLFYQTSAFLNGEIDKFCSIKEQKENIKNIYLKMSGY